MSTSPRLISAAELSQTRLARYNSRKRVNQIALTLSLAAMLFGVFWLVLILWETIRLGLGGLSVALFTQMTPPPTEVGGISNAIFHSVVMVLLAVARIAGETAPLLFTALNNQFWNADLSKPMASLPVTIFKFAMSPYENWQELAWAGVFLITVAVLGLNILARVLTRQK